MQPETITRACGHPADFTPKGDRYDDARREKLRMKRCAACGVVKNAEDNARQVADLQTARAARVKKGQEMKMLPAGAAVHLVRTPEGWAGALAAEGVEVSATMGGAMGLANKLARKWLQARGRTLKGKVVE